PPPPPPPPPPPLFFYTHTPPNQMCIRDRAKRVLELDFAATPELLERLHFCENQMAALQDADALAVSYTHL
ncbi:hypothetical protein QN416_25610, partial [Glaciimonas sp. Cout2]